MKLNPEVISKNTLKIFPTLEKRFNDKHSCKYDYSKVEFFSTKQPIIIICPFHGEFTQRPSDHLSGRGCPKCGLLQRAQKQRKSKESFISDASQHYQKDSYSYGKVVMGTSNKDKVIVTCQKHGDFKTIVNNHAAGKARCPKCSLADSSNNTTWSYSDWEKSGLKSSKFDSFKVYVIRCYNEEEQFLKIGKTYTSIGYRFRHKSMMPYEYEVLRVKEGSARYISELESRLHSIYKEQQYLPKLSFGGQYECYNFIDLIDLPNW